MANQLLAWFPVISGGVIFVTAVVPSTIKAVREIQNLRLRHDKEMRDLMAEVGNRFKKESANAWRNPDSLEDSLAKDMSVSHIFGLPITWRDWIEIRKFVTDHDVHLKLLRSAWYYRDKKEAPRISFRMRWDIHLCVLLYNCVILTWLVLFLAGLSLVWISVNTWVLKPLISQPLIPTLLNSWGIHTSQLLKFGAFMMLESLPILLFSWAFYGRVAASRICKKLKPGTREQETKKASG